MSSQRDLATPPPAVGRKPARNHFVPALIWAAVAAAVILPPVVYQYRHFFLGWHDIGNYARAIYSFFDFGRFVTSSDGADDFFAQQHFEPFFFVLAIPVRLLGTPGYVALITVALVAAAGYVFALGAEVGRSRLAGSLCAAAFIVNPYTYAIALNYHIETFGMLFLLAFAYHARARHTARAWLALVLALTVKEDMWVYVVIAALLVATRDRLRHTAAFIAAAAAYYAGAVLGIGGQWYPQAKYFNSFYLSKSGEPLSKAEIVAMLAGRWREYLPMLFTGPGLAFQLTVLFVPLFAGWRYVLACGVMLLWLTYPGGPPRSNFAYYYAYAALTVVFIVLPFALTALRDLLARLAGRRPASRVLPLVRDWAAPAAMAAVIAFGAWAHLPGQGPAPIRPDIDPANVWGKGPGVNAPVVQPLIDHYLARGTGSVLSQFYTFCSIPQRRFMYITLWDREAFLAGRLKPTLVLLDLNAEDPWVSGGELDAMAARLRAGGEYRPLYDASGVLLYQRRTGQ
jgi:hypothetical protein